ncbi:hypothetical protein AO073_07530 [Pseudomonas syringae ICMP 11293]|nr:hypothetical protein AO073_07530 [Pseudomonas syringae ICMP 11293]
MPKRFQALYFIAHFFCLDDSRMHGRLVIESDWPQKAFDRFKLLTDALQQLRRRNLLASSPGESDQRKWVHVQLPGDFFQSLQRDTRFASFQAADVRLRYPAFKVGLEDRAVAAHEPQC